MFSFLRSSRESSPRPLGRWLAGRRRAAWLGGGLVAAALAGLLIARGAAPAPPSIQWGGRPLHVLAVPDGRTLRVTLELSPELMKKGVERGKRAEAVVRLLGVAGGTDPAQRSRLREVVRGRSVTLSFDRDHPRDEAGRLPAYVYREDGRMLNEWLIERGIARRDPRMDYELASWFATLERRAKTRQRGRWGHPAPR